MSKEIKIGCKYADPDLYNIMSVCQEFLKAKQVDFVIDEERRSSTVFLYFVKVKNTNLEGYIGRHNLTKQITYMIIDAGRINWSLQEGFTRAEAFDLVGVFRAATTLDSFTKWITGEKDYKLKGKYILAGANHAEP